MSIDGKTDRRSFCLFHVSAETCVFYLWCICIPVFLILRTSQPDERRCFCLFRVFVCFVRAENKLRPCGSLCFARKAWLRINLQNRLIKEGPLEEMVKKGRVQKNSPKCADAIDTVYTRGEYLYLFFS